MKISTFFLFMILPLLPIGHARASTEEDDFPELSYENMNIEEASQKEVDGEPLAAASQSKQKTKAIATKKIAVSIYGDDQHQDRDPLPQGPLNSHDPELLVSGSAPLYQ